MSKKIRKKSSSSSGEKSRRHEVIREPASNCDMWKVSTLFLGFLLLLSVFYIGMLSAVSVNSVVKDLETLNNKELPAQVKSAVGSSLTALEKFADVKVTPPTDGPTGNAEVVIVEYSDFECPYCVRAYPTVKQVLEEYGDQVELDYKHFPLSFHANAKKAGEASECARDQGKFMEYHDILFDTKQLSVDSLKKHAADLGLDVATFNECLDSGEKGAIVDADFEEGRQLGVGGTPTFFINGRKLVGAQPYENFKAAIESALAGEVVEPEAPPTQPEVPTVPKTDKPSVELFVMSHCPYGTQMEKGMLPVVKVLENDIDFDLNFVYYAMHGATEVWEQANQYCIQRDQNDLLQDYLLCFLEAGDTEGCLDSVGVDRTSMDACVAEIDEEFGLTASLEDQSTWLSGRFPLFGTDKADNEKYGVRGSPTLVINGVQASSGRDSSSLLKVVCAAFNEPPAGCETVFESGNPSPGFGFDEASAGNAAAAGCGV